MAESKFSTSGIFLWTQTLLCEFQMTESDSGVIVGLLQAYPA